MDDLKLFLRMVSGYFFVLSAPSNIEPLVARGEAASYKKRRNSIINSKNVHNKYLVFKQYGNTFFCNFD